MKCKLKCLGLLLSGFCLPISAQTTTTSPLQSTARIEVTVGSNVYMSSGFLWGKNTQVITALHGMNPKASKIIVTCGSQSRAASVKKVLQNADLVLLETSGALEKCVPLFAQESDPFTKIKVPAVDAPLKAYGFRPRIRASKSTRLSRAEQSHPFLADIIPDTLHEPFRRLGLPSLELEFYAIDGTIVKGNSGGPVLDLDGYLVGIASGGTDKGALNNNWLLPAFKNIKDLMDSPDTNQLPQSLSNDALKKNLYSAVLINQKVLTQTPTETSEESMDTFAEDITAESNDYLWIYTKTRTFKDIQMTADPESSLAMIYDSIMPTSETEAEASLSFDIYEEEMLGLIIAVPEDRELGFELVDDGFELFAIDSTEKEAMVYIKYGDAKVQNSIGEFIYSDNENFLNYLVDDALRSASCEAESRYCEIKNDEFRVVDYGQGYKILRLGFYAYDLDENEQPINVIVNQYSYALQDEKLLTVDTVINFENDSALSQCFMEDNAQACGESFWEPASFMLANALTTFSGVVESDNILIPRHFEYACDGTLCLQTEDNYDQQIAYQQDDDFDNTYINNDGVIIFAQDQGQWIVNIGGELYIAEALYRETWFEQTYIIMSSGDYLFAVPESAGAYYEGSSGEWMEVEFIENLAATAAQVEATVPDFSVNYFNEQGVQMFQLQPDGSWMVNIGGQFYPASQETIEIFQDNKEYFILLSGPYSFAVPTDGGWYYEGSSGQWQPVSVLTR